jgi:hypothetical protein
VICLLYVSFERVSILERLNGHTRDSAL